jgi:RNA polymerase sigma-70 factor (ECF subfamily)
VRRQESLDQRLNQAGHLKLAAEPDDPGADALLVAGLRARSPGARREVVRRHGGHVRAILVRLLGGGDPERGDLLQEVFLRVFEGIDQLDAPDRFKAWLSRITVFVAREHIRRVRRRRWMTFFGGEPPETASPSTAGEGVREAVRCVYAVLEAMPIDERLVLTLFTFHGMELREIAPMCEMSYATARRRLASGRRRFSKQAARYEALEPWLNP